MCVPWFIFAQQRLLLAQTKEAPTVPHFNSPPCFTTPLRTWTWLRPPQKAQVDRQTYWVAEVAAETPAPLGYAWYGLRTLFSLISAQQWAFAARASQVLVWDRHHQFCGFCGSQTQRLATELARECPQCGLVAYPRINPAVMVLVRRNHEWLLARSAHFKPGVFSALAGFVEAGETLEEAAQRETREETGIEIANLRYFGSQSWPFPHSLMVAFLADYVAGTLCPDPHEIEAAGWFSVKNLPPLPDHISLARRLIEHALQQ